ncbi:MAG: ABC transporter permease [Spirochaetaceae bacterium]|jgi:D-methionine transport system permease protein|nr:ABC transporter permease [Spirochaetaceae bacterium]GMO19731.1 MAG: ABC transporter permease [Termitinemataceae bacterium]
MPLDWQRVFELLPKATFQTIYMVFFSTIFACIIGLPFGTLLFCASPAGLRPRRLFYNTLSRIVNLLRSFPFIILMIIIMPISRFLIKTSVGPTAVIIPLSIAAAPFVARLVEQAIQEVDYGVLTAARAMGSTNFQIIYKVLLPEALPALVSSLALTIITLIGYSAMAGALGGGGLGDMAIRFGYYGFHWEVTAAAVIVVLILVELVQAAGTIISRRLLVKR